MHSAAAKIADYARETLDGVEVINLHAVLP
jgi:hypothetical protein